MDPTNTKDIRALRKAMAQSGRQMQTYRSNRNEAIEQYVGNHYSDEGAGDKVPINYMELAVTIYMHLLMSGEIKANVTTEYEQLTYHAKDIELALNNLVENEIGLSKSVRRWGLDAMFGFGIMKVGLHTDFSTEAHGFTHDVAQPFADVVSIEDFVLDMGVKRWDQVAFAADRYRVPLQEAKNNEMYDEQIRSKLTASGPNHEKRGQGEESLMWRNETEKISRGESKLGENEFEKQVELWDVWVPGENLVLTMAAKKDPSMPLRTVDWNGPEKGPYRFLSFNEVPEQILPLPPTSLLIDIHDIANRLFNKLGRQAERQKTILGVRDGGEADGERITKAGDGEAVSIEDPMSAQEYRFGGPDQHNLGFVMQLRQMFSYQAGNLDTLGGLQAQAGTLGQEEILSERSGARIQSMSRMVNSSVGDVLDALGFYLHTDPLIEVHTTKRIPGSDLTVPVVYSAEDREGDYWQYNFDVDPYSMRDQSPQEKLRALQFAMINFIGPFGDIMSQQGYQIDFGQLTDLLSRYLDLPELRHVIKASSGSPAAYLPGPAGGGGGGGGEGSGFRSPETGNYNRRTQSVPSQQGTEQEMIQELMGGGGNSEQPIIQGNSQ